MALINTPSFARESIPNLQARFGIAQDGVPSPEQLKEQALTRDAIVKVALRLNQYVEDSREKSLALTALEEALMWAGKAIFK